MLFTLNNSVLPLTYKKFCECTRRMNLSPDLLLLVGHVVSVNVSVRLPGCVSIYVIWLLMCINCSLVYMPVPADSIAETTAPTPVVVVKSALSSLINFSAGNCCGNIWVHSQKYRLLIILVFNYSGCIVITTFNIFTILFRNFQSHYHRKLRRSIVHCDLSAYFCDCAVNW